MTNEGPLKGAELARHWEVTSGRVSQLKAAGMPEFHSFEEADAWRAVNAPGRRRKATECLSPNTEGSEAGKNRGTTLHNNRRKSGGEGAAAEVIDVTAFIATGRDFEAVMIEQAEHAPQIAYGLYRLACGSGDPNRIAAATKNWHEAAKASRGVRGDFLELQEKTHALLPLDEVLDVVGTELQGLRARWLKLDARWAARINPDNPALAQAMLREMVDEEVLCVELAASRVAQELPAPTEAPDTQAVGQ